MVTEKHSIGPSAESVSRHKSARKCPGSLEEIPFAKQMAGAADLAFRQIDNFKEALSVFSVSCSTQFAASIGK